MRCGLMSAFLSLLNELEVTRGYNFLLCVMRVKICFVGLSVSCFGERERERERERRAKSEERREKREERREKREER